MIAAIGTDRPAIDGIPLCLGDIVIGPEVGGMVAGRVKGWSDDCDRVYVGWLGIVALTDLAWCDSLAIAKFPGLYKPATSNEWGRYP